MVLDTRSADLSERLILFHFCQNKLETVETDLPLIKLAYGDIESLLNLFVFVVESACTARNSPSSTDHLHTSMNTPTLCPP